jgi:phage baseplate assembly protein W|tara:strand:- start:2851 stop:3288 length:438 start_codon:yes stop_codon:yes gene_type:complete
MALPNTVRELSENEDYRFGLTFPLTYNNQLGGFFPSSKTLREQVSSNIKNLLLTSKGERVGQPEFGTDVTAILFEPITPDIGDRLEASITDGISQWLPYVTIQNIFVSTPDDQPNSIFISIEFSVDIEDPDVVETITFNFNTVEE